MHQSIPQTPSHVKVFTACLLSFLTLFAPIASVAAATTRAMGPAASKTPKKQLSAAERLEAALFEPMAPVVGPVITATKVDSFPSHVSGQAEPGDAITYDVNVANTGGADATNVNFSDTIDPNTTLVPGSLKVSPLAFADTYVAEKNVALIVGAPGVLTNDTGIPAPTAVPIAAGATTQAGTVTLNADGSFNYTPAANFTGTDTFAYTATNGLTPNDTATVTITVDAPPAVTTTTPANSATNVATNTNIVVNFSESVAATTSSFTIVCTNAGSQAFTLSASPSTAFTLTPTGGLPAGDDCTVTVIANQISDTDTADPPDNMLTNFVFSFKVAPDAINDTYPVTLVGNVSTNSFSIPFSVTTNDISAAAYTISAVQGFSTIVTNTITTTSVNGGNIVMTVSGADRGKFTYDPPAGFEGTDTFTYTISRSDGGGTDTATVSMPVSGMVWFINNGAAACIVAGCGRLSNPFSTLAAFNTLNDNGGGTHPGNNDNIFIYESASGYSGAVTLLTGQKLIGQDATVTLSTITGLTPPSGSPSFPAMNTGGNTSNITSTVTLNTNATVRGLSINSTTSTGMNDPAGAITGVNVSEVSVTTTTGTAVSLTSDTGTFSFISISANGAPNGVLVDTAPGSFTVNGTGSTAGSGGTIQNTTSSGMKFVNSNNITLKNMNLTNDGTTQSVAGSSTSCGGDLRTGTNTSCVAGLFVQTATGVALTNLAITSGKQMGIVGNDVTTFTMANSTVTGNGDEAFEDGLIFQNLKGTSSITDTIIKNNAARQIHVANTTNSSTLTLGITGTRTNNAYPTQDTSTTMIGNDVANSLSVTTQQGILFETNTTGTSISMTLNINGVVFNNNVPGNAVDIQPIAASTTLGGTFQNSSFDSNAGGVIISAQNATTGTYNVLNNEFNRSALQSILYAAANPTTGTLQGTIQGNTIGTSGQSGSACFPTSGCNGTGIDVNFIGGTGAIQLKIGGTGGGQGNTIQQFDGTGINIKGNGAGSVQANIQNNTIQNPLGLIAHGLSTNMGTTAGATMAGCFNITGNTVSGTYEDPGVGVQLGIVTNVRFLSHHNLPGYGGSTTAVGGPGNAVTDFIIANNTTSSKVFTQRGGSGDYPGGAACTTPLLFAEGGVESLLKSPSLLSAFALTPLFTSGNGSRWVANAATSSIVSPSHVTASLDQQQLDWIVAAAIERWTVTGLGQEQISALNSIKFDVTDLGGAYLGESSNNHVQIDRNAGGKGWYTGADSTSDSAFSRAASSTRRYTDPLSAPAGHLDLLTAIEHEMGHKLGLNDSYAEQDRDNLMYGYLTVGERRLPAADQAKGIKPNALAATHFLMLGSDARQRSEARDQRSEVRHNHARSRRTITPNAMTNAAPLAPPPPPTISQSIGTLKGGKTVHIQFQVTITIPFGGTNSVSNQGTVSGSNFSNVLTDDPAVGGASDPTVTPVVANLAPVVNTLGDAADLNVGDNICDTDVAAGNQCTLRAAIQETNNASSDDSITFDPALNGGTITLNTALDAINGNLTITGPGANLLTVARSAVGGTPDFRIFTINSGKTVTISGLTISNGNLASGAGNNGGGVLNNGTLTLSAFNVYGNSVGLGQSGGGIYSDGPALTLTNCNIGGTAAGQPNNALSSGAGIFSNSGILTVTGGSITGNTAGNTGGGGIQVAGGTATLSGVRITENHIFIAFGGGVYSTGGTVNVINCLIAGNTASGGGGVDNNGGALTIVNTTISGNTATGSGGGIRHEAGSLTLTNVTVSGNRSDSDDFSAEPGGGIFRNGGTVTLQNTIVAGNFRGTGVTVDDISGTVDSASSFNLIGNGGSGGLTNGVNNNQVGVTNPRLGPLANNGGPTQTHALLAGSPAFDAGDNTLATNAGLTTDQRGAGFARIVDGPDADTTATVDVGAFEAQVSLPDLADQTINEDGSVSLPFNVGGGAGIVSVTATSSNTTLVPNLAANIDVTGAASSRTLTINPVANAFGTATITVTVTGNNSQTMTDTLLLTVNSVNDTPSFTKGSDQNVAEDAGPQTVPGWATAISAGPANESGQSLTFLVTNNTNSALFSTQPAVSSNGTLTYTPAANASGSAAITIVLMDNGGGADTSAPQTFNIAVNSTNDAPVNSVPAAQSMAENGTLTFNSANANLISISDVDAGTNPVRVTLTATNGTLSLSGIAGLSFTVGDGTADATMTFTGTVTNINAALNGLVFTPTAGFSGAAMLQIVTNDQGNTGSGGALSDTDTVNITVNDGGTLQFSAASYNVSESVGNATITITRTGGTAGTATVQFSTSNGTATAGSDYTAVTNQTVTFNNGDTSKTVAIPITNDSLDENDETVNLTLTNAGGSGALGSPASAVLTINDDDPTPSLSINDVSLAEGNSGTTLFRFTVTLSAASALPVTVNYATANGTADSSDYTAVPITLLTFNPGDTSKSVDVLVNGDILSEGNDTFFVNLTSPTNAAISDNQGLGTIVDDDAIGGTIVFSSATYTVNEDAGSVQITVNRMGTTTQAVSVDYATSDITASERKDYTTALGTLKFAAGETSKTFTVLVNQDSFSEGSELLALTLSNPQGGATLTVPQNATLQINEVPWVGPPANPLDNAQFFVREHYHDFLNREPDAAGLAFWTNQITGCGTDTACLELKRINVSAAFFLSIEFQETGFSAYLTNKVAFGSPLPHYRDFVRDTQALGRDFVFGAPGADAVLEANKVAFFSDFVNRPDFTAIYGSLNNAQYVDALISNTAVSFTTAERDALVNGLNASTETRASVLRKITEKASFKAAEFNRAFVMMEYFGYLRRNADDAPDNSLAGFNFWLNKLNQFNGNFINADMVKAFIISAEYRERFGN